MRKTIGPMLIGAILGSLVTHYYNKGNNNLMGKSKNLTLKFKRPLNFMHNFGEDLVK